MGIRYADIDPGGRKSEGSKRRGQEGHRRRER